MTKKKSIHILGARANNLQNIDIEIPYNQLVVVTGVSGSGKSSLTIDTLYAEGQRRYVESLSSYARQFLMRMKKPDVDNIKGLCPAIAIEQKVGTKNARSTVGTLTEIYDYLRILYARIGRTFSPISNQEVKKHTVSDVVDYVLSLEVGKRVMLLIPFMQREGQSLAKTLDFLLQKGYTRVLYKNKLQKIEALIEDHASVENPTEELKILIDRFVSTRDDEDNAKRIADSSQIALQEGHGICMVQDTDGNEALFNNKFELDGILFEEPSPQLFNFNSSFGACPSCEGYGQVMGIDEDKVIPNKTKSIFEEAIVCWRGEKVGKWRQKLLNVAHKIDFPVHTPYRELSEEQRQLLWTGNELFDGINAFFAELESKTYKIQNRVMLARYRGKTKCPACNGSRLRKEALYVYVGGKTIADLINIPIEDFYAFFQQLELSDTDYEVARRLIIEITTRLQFMLDVGLNYLTIDRISSTLSGGEIQRIHLTRSLGSNLTSSLYILDEPSIGLHPRDTSRLVKVLKALRDLGNTVVVVEHEEDIIANADYLVDIGPHAGVHGGKVVFAGPYENIHSEAADCLTAKYMSGRMEIAVPPNRRTWTESITIKGARQHNLKDIDVTFPLNVFIAVSGVSGSGKTTLIKQILYPAMMHKMGEGTEKPGAHSAIEGDVKSIHRIEMVNQQPIGKSSRSNPVTYVKAYDAIRKLFSSQQAAKIKGFKPKHFSFNVEGGRCETCKGAGETIVSMQFLADVRLTCDDCNGFRFQREVLGIRYKEKNIYDILNMTVEEALVFFEDNEEIITKIRPLADVGLGYIGLGQPSSTLSGGEAQRVKLASFLAKENSREKILFIFDEPTTGLHFHDIQKLLDAFNALVEIGHSIIVIEHNLDVIKSADYVIDLGRDGGIKGGQLLFQGTPEGLTEVEDSYTGQYLKEKMS
ncbi:excinuclease ABC subunit UvrA [Aureispira anguillae]|uniref:UvrABC system protein A n=1 Tax=Aureispira anguillae TaxID=2864201 RepID=A0A916DUY4_9BACT|nr:excinuclease ABC subunit UvrA [Aureispira anguillae]BDS14559.1 excinuclease ABC subunit UvrA [Aureispira anguillae]